MFEQLTGKAQATSSKVEQAIKLASDATDEAKSARVAATTAQIGREQMQKFFGPCKEERVEDLLSSASIPSCHH